MSVYRLNCQRALTTRRPCTPYVAELKRIAKIIDPDGPTYGCDSTTG